MTRAQAVIGAAATIVLGLASRRVPIGVRLWDKSLGDALYTVMVYFLIALARPKLTPARLGITALAVSVAIEIFQLTGIPSKLPRLLQIALGTTFAWHDVACYVAGALGAVLVHRLVLVARRRKWAS